MELRRRFRVRALIVLATAAQLLAISFGVSVLLNSNRADAAQQVPYKVNFQGRLTDNSGNILTDGLYNIKFRLFDALTVGTNKFEEDRVMTGVDNRVQITNGLFNIQFGDLTALSPVLFSGTYPLYLEVELPTPATASCATNGCAVFTEGAMTPRQPMASSPYAFNSDTLDGLNSASFAQLATTNFYTGANLFTPGASAVVGLTVKASTGGATNGLEVFDSSNVRQAYFNAAGSLNVGQAIQPTTNNAIDLGVVGTAFRSMFAASFDTGTVTTALTVGASNAASITIGKGGLGVGMPGGITTSNGTINTGSGSITTTGAIGGGAIIGTSLTAGAGTVTGGSYKIGANDINTGAGSPTLSNVDYLDAAQSISATKTFTKAGGSSAVYSGTAASGYPIIQFGSVAALSAGSASGTYIGSNPAAFTGDFVNFQIGSAVKLKIDNVGAVTGGAITGTSLATSANGTINSGSGTISTTGALNGGTVAATTSFTSSTFTGTGAVTVSSGAATSLTITANASSTWSTTGAGILTVQSGSGTVSLGTSTGLSAGGALTISSGGAAALKVDPGGAAALSLGTTNANAVNIGNATAATTVAIDGGTAATGISIGNSATAHGIKIGAGGGAAGNTQTIAIGSGTTTTASALFLQSGNLSTTNNTSTTGSGVIIGGGFTSDANLVGLTLDTYNTFAEPANTCTNTVNGGTIYYNSSTNNIRACVTDSINAGASWEDLPSTADLGILLFGVVPDSGLTADQGDWTDIGGATKGPCKVSWLSATTVSVAPCLAYSAGRKVTVASATTVTMGTGTNSGWNHVCFNNSGVLITPTVLQPTEIAGLPAFTGANPTLCLADVQMGTGGGASIKNIYDLRTFTTTQKELVVNQTTTAGLGQVVSAATSTPVNNGVTQMPTITSTVNLRGVVLATTGVTSTTAVNALIAIAGPQWVKFAAATGTLNFIVQPITGGAAGYPSSVVGGSAGIYGSLGPQLRVSDFGTCTASTNCQMSVPTNINIR